MVKKEYSVTTVSGRIYKETTYHKLYPPTEKEGAESATALVDEIDIGIIKLLIKDSRTTLSAIANELGIGTSTVHKRLSRLVKEGVIQQFTVIVDSGKLSMGAAAYVGINCQKSAKEGVKKALFDISEVVEIHEVLEPYDFLVKVRSYDIKTLKEEPLSRLSGLEGVAEVKPILVLNTIKETLYNL